MKYFQKNFQGFIYTGEIGLQISVSSKLIKNIDDCLNINNNNSVSVTNAQRN